MAKVEGHCRGGSNVGTDKSRDSAENRAQKEGPQD